MGRELWEMDHDSDEYNDKLSEVVGRVKSQAGTKPYGVNYSKRDALNDIKSINNDRKSYRRNFKQGDDQFKDESE